MKNQNEILIIAGNHKIDSDKNLIYDIPSKVFGEKLKHQINNSKLAYFIDNISIGIEKLTLPCKTNKFIKSVNNINPEINVNFSNVDYIIFESSIKNIASNKKNLFCSVLGKNSYNQIGETKICKCWSLTAILIYSLFDYGFNKIYFITSISSTQLKVSDAIKLKSCFENDNRFELIWAY